MSVGDVLAAAWAEVEKAGLPDHLQPLAFQEAVRLLSTNVVPEVTMNGVGASSKQQASGTSARGRPKKSAASKTQPSTPTTTDLVVPDISEDEFYDSIVRATGVDRDKLSRVMVVDNGLPRITLRAAQLGQSARERMVAVTKLIVVARTCGLGEKEVRLTNARKACEALRCLDSPNFNKCVNRLDGFTYLAGPNNTSRMRLRTEGEQSFVSLVDLLTAPAPVA